MASWRGQVVEGLEGAREGITANAVTLGVVDTTGGRMRGGAGPAPQPGAGPPSRPGAGPPPGAGPQRGEMFERIRKPFVLIHFSSPGYSRWMSPIVSKVSSLASGSPGPATPTTKSCAALEQTADRTSSTASPTVRIFAVHPG